MLAELLLRMRGSSNKVNDRMCDGTIVTVNKPKQGDRLEPKWYDTKVAGVHCPATKDR
jgi:hypothetical protein